MKPKIKDGFLVEQYLVNSLARGAGGSKLKLHSPIQSAEELRTICLKYARSDWNCAINHIIPEAGGLPLAEDIWDSALHVDFIVNWRGYLVAIDATINSSKMESKFENHERVQRALKELGIDRALSVLCITHDEPNREWIQSLEIEIKSICKKEDEFVGQTTLHI